jgi:hypothetical protein
MSKIEIKKTELVWKGKYDDDGKLVPVEKPGPYPFQIIFALYNDFEGDFVKLLNRCEDITAFAALAETDIRIDYLTSKGAIRFYYPDFVAIQKVGKQKVYWILETKGREFPELENKNKAVVRWCDQVSNQTGKAWKYLMIKQSRFPSSNLKYMTFQNFLNDYSSENDRLL